ncbi:MAG: hypothetical protein IPK82_44180 [Polyangiaceae bacterium]|nr:hypothetical protein [Polyangiaceae bacterium]
MHRPSLHLVLAFGLFSALSGCSGEIGNTGGSGELGGKGGTGGSTTGGAGTTGGQTATSTSSGGSGGSSSGGSTAGGTGGIATGGTAGTTTPTTTGGAGGATVTCPDFGNPDCSPGAGTGNADECFDAPPCYLKVVQDAVKYIINTAHPEWVDWSDGNPLIIMPHHDDYILAVVDQVAAQGLCCIQDPNAGDEIVVKHDNSFAENFDILTAQGYARYGNNIFTATCAPAWF